MNKKQRKTGGILISLVLGVSMTGCGGGLAEPSDGSVSASSSASLSSSETPAAIQTELDGSFESFDMERFTRKLWEGKTVYFETLCFMEREDGSIASGSLLYTPDKILSVRSYNLRTVYEEGRDYAVSGSRLVRTDDSRIPAFPLSEYREPTNNVNAWLKITGTDQSLRINAAGRLVYQMAVCYTHSDGWQGLEPESQMEFLPKTAARLAGKEKLKLVFYGDSITAGWDASGQNEATLDLDTFKEVKMVSGRPPYTPAWAEIVTKKLQSVYGYTNITRANRAVSGTTSTWGKQKVSALVNPEKPDLAVIAFGMNEATAPGDGFRANIEEIMDTIHAQNPDTEFLLVSCMMPNCDAETFAQNRLKEQEEALYAIQSERTDLAVGVVPVHSMFLSMQELGKLHTDYSGNNVNHPNDFAVCVYAQMILNALGC